MRLEPTTHLRRFDHIDLRVRSLTEAWPFYEALLPALGFTHEATIEGSLQYEAGNVDGAPEFVALVESPEFTPNESRIAFRADTPGEVDRLATIIAQAGARHVEGPAYKNPQYYTVVFEDPSGNRLEICHRTREEASD